MTSIKIKTFKIRCCSCLKLSNGSEWSEQTKSSTVSKSILFDVVLPITFVLSLQKIQSLRNRKFSLYARNLIRPIRTQVTQDNFI